MGSKLRMSGGGKIFARQLTLLSLIGVLAFVAVAYARGGWDALSSVHFLGLFAVVLCNLAVFGFVGKAD